ncbi:MAG: hypothetical protein J6N54_05890, partial [Bacteroidales bacterium]|nr:hypothetical protein [Bacteroidales bacterium]
MDHKPLPGAIVRLADNSGGVLKYTITARDGLFSIVSIDVASELVVSIIGYEEVRLPAPFKDYYEIELTPKTESLKESVVQARKVISVGDTTQYNIKALTNREDLTLGDVMRRVPGIEFTPTGHIKVDGKDLGKFYVNGKDYLNENYNLAAKNLNVKAVSKVEVIRNHQSIKMLQGLEESDKAAVNIILEEGYKGRVNWKLSGSLGAAFEHPFAPWAMDLSSIYLSDGRATILAANYDSEGNALKENTFDFYQIADGNRKMIRQHITGISVSSPLESKRSLFNNSIYSRAV